MSWASFGVLNVLCHYVANALRLIFLVLTTTVASIDETCVSKAAASTSEGSRLLLRLSLTVGST